jgi:hypothetical protein
MPFIGTAPVLDEYINFERIRIGIYSGSKYSPNMNMYIFVSQIFNEYKNMNIFGLVIFTEYEYEYIRVSNFH